MLRFTLSLAFLAPFALAGCPSGTPTNTAEICDNREDDDGDGQTDCADSDCATAANCTLGGEGEGEGGGGEGEGQGGEGEGEGGGAVCGDGIATGAEDCDRADLGGANCVSLGLGFTGGQLRCQPGCSFDTTGCSTDVGEGEGEGAAGEGEGEGEGGAGEGEGEGEGGAGEGEGEGGPQPDEAGPVGTPLAVTPPFTLVVNIDPVDDVTPANSDTDCFQFTVTASSTVTIKADDGGDGSLCGTLPDNPTGIDPQIVLFDAADIANPVAADDDSGVGFCSFLQEVEAAGTYIACISKSDTAIAENVGPQIGVHVSIDVVAVPPPPNDPGDETNPVPVLLDFTETTDIIDVAGATDRDCFSFTVPSGGRLTLDATTADCANDDTQIEIKDVNAAHTLLALNDDVSFPANLCSHVVAAVEPGDLIACVTRSDFAATAGDITGVTFTGTLETDVFPNVFITEIADPSDVSSTKNTRFIELFNGEVDAAGAPQDVFLIGGDVRVFSNGGITAAAHSITRGAEIFGGSTFIVAAKAADFTTDFGFTPDQVNGGISGNGNDVYGLFLGGAGNAGTEVDVFGDIGVNGTGQPWEYTDGVATRKATVTTGTTTFDVTQWTVKKNATIPGDFTPGVR